MKISTSMHYGQSYIGATKEIVEMEKAGLDCVWLAEAYSFDAVSAMGYVCLLYTSPSPRDYGESRMASSA